MLNPSLIPIPDRLPERVDLCPIVEAFFEIRFSTVETWETWPGALFSRIRETYPSQQNLPTLQIPAEIRNTNPDLVYAPLIQFSGQDFILRLGPRSICLGIHPQKYPGWKVIHEQLKFILEALQEVDLKLDVERIGVRYVDFLEVDIFENTLIKLRVGEVLVTGPETFVAVKSTRGEFTIAIKAAKGAIFPTPMGVKTGSLLDIDITLEGLDFDLFTNGINRFEEAHRLAKESFFGLLSTDFLASLKPEYL